MGRLAPIAQWSTATDFAQDCTREIALPSPRGLAFSNENREASSTVPPVIAMQQDLEHQVRASFGNRASSDELPVSQAPARTWLGFWRKA